MRTLGKLALLGGLAALLATAGGGHRALSCNAATTLTATDGSTTYTVVTGDTTTTTYGGTSTASSTATITFTSGSDQIVCVSSG